MGETTGIAWTDHTFNPWWGCMKVSAGCTNCYAEAWDKRTGGKHWGPGSERRTFGEKHWREPVRWNAAAQKAGKRARVFCASMADVFEDHPALPPQRERLFALIRETPWLDWQLLTKRPENIASMLPADWGDGYPNVWLGTTVEDQAAAEKRIPHLIRVPAAVRFLSCEPLLGPVELSSVMLVRPVEPYGPGVWLNSLTGHVSGPDDVLPRAVDWVIVGGESGPKSRPFALEWARSLVGQCKAAGVACFMKQLGAIPTVGYYDDSAREWFEAGGLEWPTPIGWSDGDGQPHLADRVNVRGEDPKGGDWNEWPEDLRVREFPTEASPKNTGGRR